MLISIYFLYYIIVWQINIRGIYSKREEIQNYLTQVDNPPHIFCLQETFLKDNKEVHFLNYSLVNRNRRNKLGGGCAIYIHDTVNYKLLNISDKLEYLRVCIQFDSFEATIVNFYNPPDTAIHIDTLNEFLSQPCNKNIIILGDFNSHNPIWGSCKTDNNGTLLQDFMENNDLVLLNDGSPTRYDVARNIYSAIDLSIVTSSIANKCHWQVLPDKFDSDHFLISIELVVNNNNNKYNINTRNVFASPAYHRADWEVYKEVTKRLDEKNIIDEDTDKYYVNIVEAIRKCVHSSIPLTTPSPSRNPTPWWNKQCGIAIKKRNKAKRRYMKTIDMNDFIEYKKLKALAQRTLRKAKSDYLKCFCSNLNFRTPTSKVWSKIKSITNSNSNINTSHPIKNEAGLFINDSLVKCNLIADFFAEKLYDENLEVEYPNIPMQETHNEFLNERIEKHELIEAINTSKNSTPGPDNIRTILVQKCHQNLIDIILNFFNYVWDRGILPRSWHHAIVIPIPKPGKSKSLVNSYRPVSLTCSFCKIMERIVNNRLNWYLEKYNILCPEQSGFRPGRSTIDNAIKLHDDILKALIKKKMVCAVFMDLDGAFDATQHPHIVSSLQSVGIKGRMLRWICDFLRDRTFHVRMEGAVSEIKSTNKGIPQGSVISPTLFNIFLHTIKDSIDYTKLSIYADDIAIWKEGSNVKHMKKQMQLDIDNILSWTKRHDINISQNKTKFMVFKNKNKKVNFQLCLDNYNIEKVSKFKFLGIHFDSLLTWKSHIDEICKKCFIRLNILKSITGSFGGANCKTLLLFYRQYIRPILEYGSELFNTAAKTHLYKLDSIQYTALKLATGAIKTTSLQALQTLTNERPLDIIRQLKDDKYKIRILSNPNGNLADSCLMNSWEYGACRSVEPFYIRTINVDSNIQVNNICPIPPWHLIPPNIDVTIHDNFTKKDSPHLLKAVTLDRINTEYTNHLHMYTDGSKDPINDVTACSVFVPFCKKTISKRISNISICRAEQTAIVLALEWLCVYRPLQSVIFTDSLSTLLLLKQSFVQPNIIIQEILLHVRDLIVNGTDVTLCWIPSHCDISGNEVADLLAKKALSNTQIDILIKPNKSEKINERIRHYNKIWQARWDAAERGRLLYSAKPKVTEISNNKYLPRRSEVIYNRLILGKAGTNATLHLLKVTPFDTCVFCHKTDTVFHYIFDCLRHSEERKILKEKLGVEKLTPATVFCNTFKNIQLLLEYVKSTNMMNKL